MEAGVTFDPSRAPFRAWLTRIAHDLAIDSVRVRKAVPVDPTDFVRILGPGADEPEQRSLRTEASAELRSAIRRLPPEQARAIVMAGLYGMTAREVAEADGIPLGTAKTPIRVAIQVQAPRQSRSPGVSAMRRADLHGGSGALVGVRPGHPAGGRGATWARCPSSARCPKCRREAAGGEGAEHSVARSDPGTETPPLGFDRRVPASGAGPGPPPAIAGRLDCRHGRRPRGARSPVWRHRPRAGHGGTEAYERLDPRIAFLHAGSRTVGVVFDDQRAPLVVAHDGPRPRRIRSGHLRVVGPDGTITALGSFDLVHGSGSWGAPVPRGTADVMAARLVDTSGHVVARGAALS